MVENRPFRDETLYDREAGSLARTQPLVTSEEPLRDVGEVASHWIWETDTELRLTFISKRFGDTSGIALSEANGRAFGDLVALGFDPAGMAELRTAMAARGGFNHAVHRVVLAAGGVRFWRLSGTPYFDESTGAFVGYRGSGTDVTATMERDAAVLRAEAAEREAREAQARLIDAINAIPEGFVLHDAEDHLVLCNARYGEMYGLAARFMTPGASFGDFLRATAGARTYALGTQTTSDWITGRTARHRAGSGSYEEQLLTNGRWLQIEERRTSDGGIVGIHIDVTEARQRKAAERERDLTIGELKAAHLMQTSLLPSAHLQREIMASSGLDIASRSASSSELGGDLWGINSLGRGRVGVYTVDFAGHGTSAALNTFRLHTLVHEIRNELAEPAGFLKALNLRLADLLSPGDFATMFYGIIDPDRNCITYAAAGSPPPVLRRGKDLPLTCLDGSGMPLGITSSADYICGMADFGPGAMLVLYSDMLTDFVDEHGERAGEVGAFDWIRTCAAAPTAEAMVSSVCARFLDAPAIPLSDDLTVVCIMRA